LSDTEWTLHLHRIKASEFTRRQCFLTRRDGNKMLIGFQETRFFMGEDVMETTGEKSKPEQRLSLTAGSPRVYYRLMTLASHRLPKEPQDVWRECSVWMGPVSYLVHAITMT
ncbi:hypothetical protein STEG23_016161, partial [Scotinomys teguina]